MSVKRVIETARGELGQTENPPGSNRVKYWEVMPSWNGQPWCVVFLLWCFRKAGEAMAFFGGAFTASCSTLLAWFKSQGQTVPVSDVRPGDIVLLNFHGGKGPEHCGLVESAARTPTPAALIAVNTIEGNTSEAGNQSNGGRVCRKTRYPSQIVGVCRPTYQEDEEQVDDIKGHWAEKDIKWCVEHGVMQGYPDGSFDPEKPVTRAELAVVVRRVADLLIGGDDRK